MNSTNNFSHKLMCVTLLLLLIESVGCSSKNSAGRLYGEISDSNIKRVCTLYTAFQGDHAFRGPKDESELKAYAAAQEPARLKLIQVNRDRLDELFVSERDQQPFKFRWGLVAKSREPPVPIVFESAGVDGKFMVAFSSFVCKEVEQQEYDRLLSGKSKPENPDARPD